MLGDLAPLTAARVRVLAHDQDVEDACRDAPELAHVLVAAIARGGDHGDAAARLRSIDARRGQPFDEIAGELEAVRVVGIVDDHLYAVQFEHIEASRRFVERRMEAA